MEDPQEAITPERIKKQSGIRGLRCSLTFLRSAKRKNGHVARHVLRTLALRMVDREGKSVDKDINKEVIVGGHAKKPHYKP